MEEQSPSPKPQTNDQSEEEEPGESVRVDGLIQGISSKNEEADQGGEFDADCRIADDVPPAPNTGWIGFWGFFAFRVFHSLLAKGKERIPGRGFAGAIPPLRAAYSRATRESLKGNLNGDDGGLPAPRLLSSANRWTDALTKMETTLLLLKPDALNRGFAGRIISRFEDKGLQIVGLRMLKMDSDLAAKHYATHEGKPFYEGLVSFMTSSPIVAVALQGPRAIEIVRKIMGATFGADAEAGSIRGDFSCTKTYNLVHGSDSLESAERELTHFFPDGLQDWKPSQVRWTREEG